jgi:hypothetical protein
MKLFRRPRVLALVLILLTMSTSAFWLSQAPITDAQIHKECHWECWDSEFIALITDCVPSNTPNCTSCILVCHGVKNQ